MPDIEHLRGVVPIIETHDDHVQISETVRHRHYKNNKIINWPQEEKSSYLPPPAKWLTVIATGVLLGVATFIIDYGSQYTRDLRTGFCSKGYLSYGFCETWHTYTSFSIVQYPVYIIFSCVWGLIAFLVIRMSPYLNQSGIPELRSIVSGYFIDDFVSVRVLLTKISGLVFVVGSGLWVGKEGPLSHVACCIVDRFLVNGNEATRRKLYVVATAAGISVAFKAPIGGVLFSMEMLKSYFGIETLMWESFVMSMTAVVSVNFMNRTNVAVSIQLDNTWLGLELLGFCIVGILGGLVGVGFNKLNLWFGEKRKLYTGKLQQYEILLVVLVTAVITWPMGTSMYELLSQMLADCKEGDTSNVCKKGFVSYAFLVVSFVQGVILASYSYGMAIPCGVLIPSITIGATMGRFFGLISESIQSNCSGGLCVSPSAYAVVGAAAMLTGVTRLTISSVVIIFEMTGALTYVIPIMIAVLLSKCTADFFDERNIYDLYSTLTSTVSLAEGTVVSEIMDTVACLYEDEPYTHEQLVSFSKTYDGMPMLESRDCHKLVGWMDLQDVPDAPLETLVDRDVLTVRENCSTSMAHTMFTELSLQLLVVLDDNGDVVGVVNRF